MRHRDWTRREILQAAAAAGAISILGCRPKLHFGGRVKEEGVWVNDVHSQINRTRVEGIEHPQDVDELRRIVRDARRRSRALSICGGRHAGGGQQFSSDRLLVDLSALNRVLDIDETKGTVRIEAGTRWPAVLSELQSRQDSEPIWSIHQKQGGADELSLGGALAANVHGRCLRSRPIVQDVVEIQLLLPDGELLTASRQSNRELFRRVIGGYGLFGVVTSVTLQLERRQKLARRVEWTTADKALARLHDRREGGALHGDFQFAIDPKTPDFCHAGVCSWYEPASSDAAVTAPHSQQLQELNRQLLALAHGEPGRAMDVYRDLLLRSDGTTVNWSDDWQHGDYEADYHRTIDALREAGGSEILSELYVPRDALTDFLAAAARVLREDRAQLIYGVVRFIERDDETYLAWAREPWACVIFNLHTRLTSESIEKNAATFRRLLDEALARGGSYYLTYHRAARRDQTEKAYPQFREFLAEKRKHDPREVLASDWYRHYRTLFAI